MKKKKKVSKNIKKTRNYSIILFIAVIIVYLLLALIFTAPLLFNFNTSIIGDSNFTDGPFFIWNLWWVRKSAELHINPFFSNYVYYPSQTNLALHTLTLTRGVMSLVLQNFFSLITVNNIIQISSIALSGFGTYYLIYYFTKDRISGIISGIIFAFSPFVFSHLLAGHINLADLSLIPFAVLFFIKMIREDKWYNVPIAAFLLVFVCYDDLQIGFYLSCLLLIIGLSEIITNIKGFFTKSKIIEILVFLIIVSIYFLIPYILFLKGFWSEKSLGVTYNNGDLRSYLMKNPFNPLSGAGNLRFTESLIGGYRENTLSIGWTATSFAILSFVFIKKNLKEKLVFLSVAIIFIILSMGPQLQINGKIYDTHLPFFYLQNFKIFSIGIVTTRFIVIAYLALAILAGLFFSGLRTFITNQKSKFLTVIFYLILAFAILKVGIENYSGPVKLTKLEPASKLLDEIKNDNEKDAVTLMSLCGVKGAYYQTKMNRKIISGSLGRRVHDYYMLKYRNYPGVNFLTLFDNKYLYLEDSKDQYKQKVEKSFQDLNVKYILLCKNMDEAEKFIKIKEYLFNFGWGPYKEDEFVVLYKLK